MRQYLEYTAEIGSLKQKCLENERVVRDPYTSRPIIVLNTSGAVSDPLYLYSAELIILADIIPPHKFKPVNNSVKFQSSPLIAMRFGSPLHTDPKPATAASAAALATTQDTAAAKADATAETSKSSSWWCCCLR